MLTSLLKLGNISPLFIDTIIHKGEIMNELKEWYGEDISDINFTYPHKTQCPKCASEGGDRSGDNLHIYGLDDDGKSLGAYCFDEDTDVFTYNGIKKIKDLIGKQTRIVNGNAEWKKLFFVLTVLMRYMS